MKNPLMSMWMSAANKAIGTGRGLMTAEMRRQQSAAAKEAMRAAGTDRPDVERALIGAGQGAVDFGWTGLVLDMIHAEGWSGQGPGVRGQGSGVRGQEKWYS